MCQWRNWLKGLPALVLLMAAALYFSPAVIEAELADRADRLLINVGESWAHARFDGRDAVLEGEALSEDARVKVRTEIGRMAGVRIVDDRTTMLPERRPFTFAAIRDGTKLHLEGYVPSPFARRRIVEAAQKVAPGIIVSGAKELVRARGVPAGDFTGVVIFGLNQLAKLQAGRITLSDDAFSIEGRAPNFATYDELEVTVRSELPADFKLARFAVLPPAVSPFVWSAAREPDGVVLDGYIPLGDARRALLDMVRAAVPGAAISDRLRLADGSPPADGWLKAASFALSQLGRLPNGRVTLSGTTIAIEGAAPDFAAYDAMAGARRALPEGYTLTRFAVEPPKVTPFTWAIQRGQSGLRLTGYAPSEEAKRLVLDAIKSGFPGVPLADEMRIAAGGPSAEAWVNGTVFAVGQLSKLRAGAVRGRDSTLIISGEAVDSAAFTSVQAALTGTVPGGLALQADVRPPVVSPYVFSLRKDVDGLTISGFFPDAAQHGRLVAAAKAEFLGIAVNDVSALAQGAPAGFSDAAMVALQELARLSAGEARFDDSQLRITGTVLYPAAIASMQANFKASLPPGFALELGLDVAPPVPLKDRASCQSAIDDLLARGRIAFGPTGAIAPGSQGLLDHIAAAASACPDALVDVRVQQAETDSVSVADRIKSVVDYLARAGISPDRLITAPGAAMAQGSEGTTVPGVGSDLQLIVR